MAHHPPLDPLDRRVQEREAEQQKKRAEEVKRLEQEAINKANWENWFDNSLAAALTKPWFDSHLTAALFKEDRGPFYGEFIDALGLVLHSARKEYRPRLDALEAKTRELEQKVGFENRFIELERHLDARQLARDEARRPSEMIPQTEVLAKIATMQRRVDDLNGVADLDVRFRELAERVTELERTGSLEARFAKLASEAKVGPEIPQGELLAKIETLQRQVDDLKRVADVDVRELAGRVTELEQTNSLEARFTKLANEAKGGPEVPQSELLAKTEELQRQIDEVRKVGVQPGPQGPQGPPGKLPRVKEYAADRVHYEADVVVHAGGLWQASGDTVHAPPHSDWICIARAGRDGSDGRSPNVCGTYDARTKYERLDIVAHDGGAFIARRDDPGICPGDGWQLLASRGKTGDRGQPGPRGDKGERGEPGATVVSWQLDRERYRISPLMSDGKVGPNLELRALFEQFLSEIELNHS